EPGLQICVLPTGRSLHHLKPILRLDFVLELARRLAVAL
ncbi:MAG: hypothetical protein ACI8S6_004199, partial [Myxococcota bacterium]